MVKNYFDMLNQYYDFILEVKVPINTDRYRKIQRVYRPFKY